jgi:hypothetical protein
LPAEDLFAKRMIRFVCAALGQGSNLRICAGLWNAALSSAHESDRVNEAQYWSK